MTSRPWLRLCLLLGVVASLWPSYGNAQSDPALDRLTAASAIQGATRARLGVLGDAFTCPDARFASYRRSDEEPQYADQWYVASQLWADAVLLNIAAPLEEPPVDVPDTRCYIDKGFVFLDRLWDFTSAGYFARADPVGRSVDNGPRFTDDNMVAGLALLEAAKATSDPLTKQRYLHAARRQADFLLNENTGVWDETFGGGFWWNTDRGANPEGKPAQTNALAALFFARLYEATGEPIYREWALRTLLWLDTILYDPQRHLYRWSVSYPDPAHPSGGLVSPRVFNYDQAIGIEAQLAAMLLDGDQNRLRRAQDVGRATHDAFWSPMLGGYNLESGIEQVYTSYGAWTSLGHLALFDADHDPKWLSLAADNVQGMNTYLRETDQGYGLRTYKCVDRFAPGCESGTVSQVVDHVRDTAAQAWTQHLHAALAQRGLTVRPPMDGAADTALSLRRLAP